MNQAYKSDQIIISKSKKKMKPAGWEKNTYDVKYDETKGNFIL